MIRYIALLTATLLLFEESYKEFDEFINWPEVTEKATISKSEGRLPLKDHLAILPASLQETTP